ncbi:hypothetical protein E2C01_053081 [Portunus trituberculatus]|uniref:Uncharacterized protein n=1 Tax=Portunus trituberculatus TaxID=210409 RepID=A0A5B7GPD4_PORTR|nr:hypothetical protein [Portunus trituberculatus]
MVCGRETVPLHPEGRAPRSTVMGGTERTRSSAIEQSELVASQTQAASCTRDPGLGVSTCGCGWS